MRWLSRLLGERESAASSLRSHARPKLEGLEERVVPTVNYYGGNVLTHVEAQALFYGSDWSTTANTATQATLNTYLSDLTGGAYMDALTQAGYHDQNGNLIGRGTASAGYQDPTQLTSGSVITDASIHTAIQNDITNNHLQAPDANRLYVVYVDPNVAVNLGMGQGTTQQGILGYHGAFAGTTASGAALTIRYAVVVTPGGPAHNSSEGFAAIDQLTAVTSHEVAEAVTDPDVNYGTLGWYDPQKGEIGDITENQSAAYVRLSGSQGNSYLVQEVAGQNDQLLALGSGNPPPSQPPAGTVATTTHLSGVVAHGYRYPAVTFTVTVTPSSGTAQPGGTVELLYNGTVLTSSPVRIVNGVAEATFTVMFSGRGNYNFTAVYLGSSSFQGSTSNSVGVQVT
jgi:hypothetical protein